MSAVSLSATEDEGATRASIRARVRAAGTSFYWAMRLLPEDRREAMFAIYAFCREVDDIADSDDAPAAKLAALEAWRNEIAAIYAGTPPQRAVARVLVGTVRRFALRREDFIAVIDGMEMDARETIRAPSLAAFDLYCDRVASAVGRLSVRIFGSDRPAADRVAHALGRALQTTNILRDLAEDAARGRLYLPRELMLAAGISASDPETVLRHPALGQVCTVLAQRAEQHFSDAAKAMAECPRRVMRPAAVMGAVYHAILLRLCARGWTRLDAPVGVSKPAKLWLVLRHGLL